jgi:hypothetical protein
MRTSMSEQLSLPFQSSAFASPPVQEAEDVVEKRAAPRPRLPAREVGFEKATRLARTLSANLGFPVRLYVTDNRSTMVSFRKGLATLQLRVHHMFLDAPTEVIRALADYSGRGRPRAGRVIDSFVKNRSDAIRKEHPSKAARSLEAAGQHHDLLRYYAELNVRHFDGAVQAHIGWGTFSRRRRRRSIRMGVYDHDTRTIRIHPALDRPEVPAYFVAFIVFHEMLHQAVPGRSRGGRNEYHSVEFRRRERTFPDYARAIAWEKKHLGLLLSAWPQ